MVIKELVRLKRPDFDDNYNSEDWLSDLSKHNISSGIKLDECFLTKRYVKDLTIVESPNGLIVPISTGLVNRYDQIVSKNIENLVPILINESKVLDPLNIKSKSSEELLSLLSFYKEKIQKSISSLKVIATSVESKCLVAHAQMINIFQTKLDWLIKNGKNPGTYLRGGINSLKKMTLDKFLKQYKQEKVLDVFISSILIESKSDIKYTDELPDNDRMFLLEEFSKLCNSIRLEETKNSIPDLCSKVDNINSYIKRYQLDHYNIEFELKDRGVNF